MPPLVTVAGIQMDMAFADPRRNMQQMVSQLNEAAGQGAALVVFPECSLTGYCFESLDEARPLAQTLPGPATDEMAAVCAEHGVWAVFGLLESDGPRVFNALALVGPEGFVAGYRKIHLPGLGIDRFATPGDRPFAVHEAAGLRIGMHICYDSSFPEAARVMALDGADLLVLPTNWPPAAACMAACAVNTRAMENHVYYLAVNRIGSERGFRFIGHSKLAAPEGETISELAHEEPGLLLAEVDVAVPRNKRLVRVPGKHEIHRFRDRRPEMYGRLVEPVARD